VMRAGTLPMEIVHYPVYRGGRVVRALGFLRDLSEARDLTEDALSQERLFRAVAEHSLDMLSIVDREGLVRWVSPAVERTLGFTGAEIIGKPFVELMAVHERAAFADRLAQLLREAGNTDWHTARMRHKDGTTRELENRSVSLIHHEAVDGVLIVSRDHTDEQRARWVEDVIAAQENERRRVARELHDSTGQTLISLLVSLSTLEKRAPAELQRDIAELRLRMSKAADEVGSLAKGLHPSVLDDHGLPAALERLSESFAATGLKIDTQLVGFTEGKRLPSALETTLFRVAQESLTNVVKHASANTVSLTVDWRGAEVRLVVEDDGRGFDASATSRGRAGLGIRGIQERVTLVRGEVAIESAPDKGTAVYVRVPVTQ
jgi:PAS domain S-box-containing protein